MKPMPSLAPDRSVDNPPAGGRPAPAAENGRDSSAPSCREALAEIWMSVLGAEPSGPEDNFFKAGGDSMAAVDLLVEIRKRFGRTLTVADLLEGPSFGRIAASLDRARPGSNWTSLVPLQPGGSRKPFYLVHGIGGELLSFSALPAHWDADQPLYGLRVRTVGGEARPFRRIEDMAAHYLGEVRQLQPEGPYHLGGFSFGGAVALEMAQQLHRQGQHVGLLAILDHDARQFTPRQRAWSLRSVVGFMGNLPRWVLDDLVRPGSGPLRQRVRAKLSAFARRVRHRRSGAPPLDGVAALSVFDLSCLSDKFGQVIDTHYRARKNYRMERYPGRVTLFRSRTRPLFDRHEHDLGWGELADGGVGVHVVPGNHATLLREPHVRHLAAELRAALASAQATRVAG